MTGRAIESREPNLVSGPVAARNSTGYSGRDQRDVIRRLCNFNYRAATPPNSLVPVPSRLIEEKHVKLYERRAFLFCGIKRTHLWRQLAAIATAAAAGLLILGAAGCAR